MRNLTVVGGIYREISGHPRDREVYGSGGRAAAAVSAICSSVRFLSYAPPDEMADLAPVFAPFGIIPELTNSKVLINFRYLHGLAIPDTNPALADVVKATPIQVSGEAVLRYGMVEGECVVDADVAVYDPQSPGNPERFSANGSKARRLAYVVNESEAKLLTNLDSLDEQLKWLHEIERAEVVVIKRGPFGAEVSSADGMRESIPAYKTARVWPIGSGDVFSAIFAAYWAGHELPPVDAARRASLATAYYCENRVLPIPADLESIYQPEPITPRHGHVPQVYLAGPFFNISQFWLVETIRSALLGMGVKVFSPLHDVGDGPAKEVAPDDLAGLDASDVVFAILDGLDAGTLVEVGYAIARDVPVVAFTELETEDNMTMLTGTGCLVEGDLVSAAYKCVWKALEG